MTLGEKLSLVESTLEFYALESAYLGETISARSIYTGELSDVRADSMSPVMQDRGQRARDLLAILHRETSTEHNVTSTVS